MAYTESDLAAIRTARLRAVRTVQYGERTVTYTSDAEMRQVERDILREIRAAAPRSKQFYITASKGL